jgi:hypothetical protein
VFDLRQFAVRYRLGLQDTESLLRAADALIAEGHTEPAVIELSILESPVMAEAAPVFERVCEELGVTIPAKEEAINELLHCYLESIASGALLPHDGLSLIMREVYWLHVSKVRDEKYVGDSRGLEHLIGAYWAYDDLADSSRGCSWDGKHGEEAIASWEQFVRNHAKDWLEKHTQAP